mgnify:CR=1 FL=1
MDIYRDAKRRGIYPPLFTDPYCLGTKSECSVRCGRYILHVFVQTFQWLYVDCDVELFFLRDRQRRRIRYVSV